MAKIKGICRNEECELLDQIQEAEKSHFKCEECGRDLLPFGDEDVSDTGGKKRFVRVGLVALAVLLLAGVLYYIVGGGGREPGPLPEPIDTLFVVPPDTLPVDTPPKRDTLVVPTPLPTDSDTVLPPPPSPEPRGQTLHLSYGTYVGETKNGYPHGFGRLTFSKRRQLNRYDTEQHVAEAGDYVTGEFRHGFFIQGRHYGADNRQKGLQIMVGVQPKANEYEDK